MPRLVRSATLSNYVEVAKSVGLDPYRMISTNGLPTACLSDPDIRVSSVAVVRLLEASAALSGKPDFALRLAEKRSLSNLGPMALLVREQPTVRKALEALIGYMHLHSEALFLNLEEHDDLAILTLAIDTGRPIPVKQGVELGVAFLHRSLQHLLHERWKPLAVHFAHDAPMRRDAHRRFFGTTVEFNQDQSGIVCRRSDIDVALPTADAALARHVQQYLDTLSARPSASMCQTVRDCVHAMLSSGSCSADDVARRLGVDRRTIHRHLAAEGETFTSLLDAIRAELAMRYVSNRERPLASIAELLGFSALSAFSRWFRRHFGASVTEWRELNVPRSTGHTAQRQSIRSQASSTSGGARPKRRSASSS